MNELLVAALGYAAKGWPVFPVQPDKRPRTTHGFKDASRNPSLLTEWWRRWPDSGIGLAIPDGLLVVDVDPRNGGTRGRELPATKEAGTRSGGAHLYYSVPPDLSFVGQYSQGVDLKAPHRGYVILPPTPGYTWTRRGPQVPLPRDVLDRCTRESSFDRLDIHQAAFLGLPWELATRYGQVALDRQVERVMEAENGTRNNVLNDATYGIAQLVAGGELDEDHAMKALFEAALKAGLGEFETAQTMKSAAAAGSQHPRRAP